MNVSNGGDGHEVALDKTEIQKLITGIEYEPLQVRAVSTAVNKTGRGGSKCPELIEPIDEHGDQFLQLAATSGGVEK